MDRGAVGPVVLVQSRGSTVLEQLRPDGSRLVLEAFHDESRLPHGLAVDPTGRYAAYGTSSGTATGPAGLVVRDLRTGEVVVSRSTRLPYGVRDWVTSGVVLTVALDPGGPPYRWVPGPGRPVPVTLAGPRTRWAVPPGRCAVREQLDGHRGRLHRARRRPRGGAGPAVLPEAARGAGRLVAGRRSHRGSRGPPRARGPRPPHRAHHPARHPGAGVRLAGGVGAARTACSSRSTPSPAAAAGCSAAGWARAAACRWRSARAVGRRTSCCPADDRQRGSIPQLSRVSHSWSTRSSSASSARVTQRTSSASSPGTGEVGPVTAQA